MSGQVGNQNVGFPMMWLGFCISKGVVTPKQKSLDADLRLIAKNSFSLIDLLLFVPVNSFGHVGTLDVERDTKAINRTNKNPFLK